MITTLGPGIAQTNEEFEWLLHIVSVYAGCAVHSLSRLLLSTRMETKS